MKTHTQTRKVRNRVLTNRLQKFNDRWTGFQQPDPFVGDRVDPQSIHKYAYVHGDPLNGIDPTGKFLTAVGSAIVSGIGSHISVKDVGVSLAVLDRASTAVDAFKAFSSLVATGTIPLPLLAGLLISIVPGSGLAKIAGVGGKFLSPFIRAGRLTFHAGGDVVSFLARGGTGRLDDAADVMTDVFRGLRTTVADKGEKKVVQFAGDLGAVKVADKLGLEAADDFLIRHTGIDGLYKHGDDLVIVEAKGFTEGTSISLGQTNFGQQLSQDWIRRKAAELQSLARNNPAYTKSAEILRDAVTRPNSIKILLTKTKVNQAGDEILDVTYELRNWVDIGTDTFHSAS